MCALWSGGSASRGGGAPVREDDEAEHVAEHAEQLERQQHVAERHTREPSN